MTTSAEIRDRIAKQQKFNERTEVEIKFKVGETARCRRNAELSQYASFEAGVTPKSEKALDAAIEALKNAEIREQLAVAALEMGKKNLADLQLEEQRSIRGAAFARLEGAIASRIEPLQSIDEALARLFDALQLVREGDKIAVQDATAADVAWEPWQLQRVLERLIADALHRIMTDRAPEPLAQTLENRLQIALRHPTPEPAQANDLKSEIEAAVETITE